MNIGSMTQRVNTVTGRLMILVVAVALILVALPLGNSAIGAPPEAKGDFAGPNPEDIRSFTCRIDDTTGPCAFITNPGEQSNFVVTDLILEGVGSTDVLSVRLQAGATEMGVFTVRLDDQGFGNRDLHFQSGLVATTNPGSLAINVISGNGTINATISGYYFNEGA